MSVLIGASAAYVAAWAVSTAVFPPGHGAGLGARLAWPVLALTRGVVLGWVFGERPDPRVTVRSAYQRFRAEEGS